MNIKQAQSNMIDNQLRPSGVREKMLLEAFQAVPRASFLPPALKELCYTDQPFEIANQTYMLPGLPLGQMIQAASIDKNDLVLMIGDVTGYASTVVSQLANTVLLLGDKSTKEKTKENIQKKLDKYSAGNIVMMDVDDVTKGYKKEAPYDIILVVGGGISDAPQALLDQLSPRNGRLLAVQNNHTKRSGTGVMITRRNKKFSSQSLFDTYIPYMRGFGPQPCFSF